MEQSTQISLFHSSAKQAKFFGGALLHGRRKSIRPLSSKDSVHFVLRSTWAKGSDSFLAQRNFKAINRIITRFAKKFGVRIYKSVINSNHLHLLLRITNRKLYNAYIKAVSGQIASHVMQQKSFKDFFKACMKVDAGGGTKALNEVPKASKAKGIVVGRPTGFWEFRPFSRVVNWGRDFKNCVGYLQQNFLEAFGFVHYRPRKNHYTAWVKSSGP